MYTQFIYNMYMYILIYNTLLPTFLYCTALGARARQSHDLRMSIRYGAVRLKCCCNVIAVLLQCGCSVVAVHTLNSQSSH